MVVYGPDKEAALLENVSPINVVAFIWVTCILPRHPSSYPGTTDHAG
jgi:hypothetical protein